MKLKHASKIQIIVFTSLKRINVMLSSGKTKVLKLVKLAINK
jgi:hypothetical protein